MPVLLAIIVIAQLMLGIDSTVVVVAMPTIGAELGLDVVDQSWIQTSYVVTFGGLLLLGGRLGDVLGRRRALVIGVLLFTAASALGGLADTGPWLIAGPGAAGRRRRHHRPERGRAAHAELRRRSRPRSGALDHVGGAGLRRGARAGARRRADLVRQLAVGVADQPADRHRGSRARAAVAPRDATHVRPAGPAGHRDLGPRPRRAGVRTDPRRRARLDRPGRDRRVGRGRAPARRVRRDRAAGRTAGAAAGTAAGPRPRRRLPGLAARRSRDVRHVLPAHAVPAGGARLRRAGRRARLPRADVASARDRTARTAAARAVAPARRWSRRVRPWLRWPPSGSPGSTPRRPTPVGCVGPHAAARDRRRL